MLESWLRVEGEVMEEKEVGEVPRPGVSALYRLPDVGVTAFRLGSTIPPYLQSVQYRGMLGNLCAMEKL